MAIKYGIWFKGLYWKLGDIQAWKARRLAGYREPHWIQVVCNHGKKCDCPLLLADTREELQKYIDDPEDELSSGDYEVREYS
jgi:hypothetical protein